MILVYYCGMLPRSEPTPALSAHAESRPTPGRADMIGALASGRIHSSALLNQRRTLEIEHEGCIYQLRLTSNGKLILTK